MGDDIRRFGAVTISSGTSLSDGYDLGQGELLVGLILPPMTSAAITLAGGIVDGRTQPVTFGGPGNVTEYRDGLTYVPVYDQATGAEWTFPATTGGIYVAINQNSLVGLGFIKVRSGTNAAPVVQAADRAIIVVTMDA